MGVSVSILTKGESNQQEDILRCLKVLYGTETGEQMLARDFGLSADILDLPVSVAEARIIQEIYEKTERYEPRVEVESVEVGWDAYGTMKVKVAVVPLEGGRR